MNKTFWLIIALAIFIVVLLTYIMPYQGSYISSTAIRASQLTSSPLQALLPIQTVDLGQQGRSIFIAFVMNTHVLFANLFLAGSWIIVVTLLLFHRTKKKRFERFAKSLTLFNVILFSTGATFAMTGLFFFIGLYPQFIANAIHIYWWPLFLEVITFGLEILFLYTFWFTWGKVGTRWHTFLGFAFAVDVFFQVLLINTLASGMLTPGGATAINFTNQGIFTMPLDQLFAFWFNPTWLPLQFHRLAGAMSATGFLLVAMAMFHYSDRKDIGSKRYWDWVGSYAMIWGLLGLIFQPVLGLLYFMIIQDAQPTAFDLMMHGPRAWAMLLMVGVMSGTFISAIIYFMDRKEKIISRIETAMFNNLFKVLLIIAALCGFILVQPGWFGPLGQTASTIVLATDPTAMGWILGDMNYKYVALGGLSVIGAILMLIGLIFVTDVRETEWGHLPMSARYAGILAGILATWTIPIMGYVREGGRAPWVMYQLIPVPGMQQFPTPISPLGIFLTWLALVTIALLVMWFVFRVVSHHPEEKEEIDEEAPLPELEPVTPEDYESQIK